MSLLVISDNDWVNLCKLGTYRGLTLPSAGPATGHFWQIWLWQSFWLDFSIWRIPARSYETSLGLSLVE